MLFLVKTKLPDECSLPIPQKRTTNVQELEEPLRQLVIKQDSIAHAVNAFIENYEPVTVESQSYNNSSSFRANNVDSVEVKVYANK